MQEQSMCTFFVIYKYKVYEICCNLYDTVNRLKRLNCPTYCMTFNELFNILHYSNWA